MRAAKSPAALGRSSPASKPALRDVHFFAAPAELRRWLRANHAKADQLWVGMYKKGTGRPSVNWPQVVDEALCVGWIDGIRHSLDDERYCNRLTPRRRGSNWSTVNIARVAELTKEGRMRASGLKAFEGRKEDRSGIYAYEQRSPELPEEYAKVLRKDTKAWRFFEALPPGYRKTINWWVTSAKQEATRRARLQKLIEASARGVRL